MHTSLWYSLVMTVVGVPVPERGIRPRCEEVLQPLWQTAAGMLNATTVADCIWLDNFYATDFAQVSTWAFPSANISYIPEWKVANTAIRCNLDTAHAAVQAPALGHGKIFSFTMVREPLDRFVSGFSEINVQDVGHFCKFLRPSSYELEALDSPKRALAFLHDLVAGNVARDCWVNWHVFSMLGPLRFPSKLKGGMPYLCKLEDFEQQWRLISEKAGVEFPAFDHACGAHKTSSQQDYPPRSNMQKTVSLYLANRRSRAASMVLHQDPVARAALVCSVLLPDYVCFGYALPDGADMCVRARFATTMAAWEQVTSLVKAMLCPEMFA